MKKFSLIIQVTVFALCMSSVCVAGVVEFTDEVTFKNDTGNPQYFIDFETYGDGTPVSPDGVPIKGDEWLNLGIQFTGMEAEDAEYSLILSEKPDNHVSLTHALAVRNPFEDRCSFLITFSTPVESFGVYIIDNETRNLLVERIILKDENDNVLGDFDMPGGRGPAPPLPIAKDFRGYSSTIPIAEVQIIENHDGEGVLLDNVMYTTVPEPATVLLLGLGGLALRRRHGA